MSRLNLAAALTLSLALTACGGELPDESANAAAGLAMGAKVTTTHFDGTETCQTFVFGPFTLKSCVAYDGVSHETVTPSGLSQGVFNGTVESELWVNGVSQGRQYADRHQALLFDADGKIKMVHSRSCIKLSDTQYISFFTQIAGGELKQSAFEVSADSCSNKL